MSELRLVADDVIELDGRPVANLLPNLQLSLRDKLTEAFDTLAEIDDLDELELDEEIERLIRALAEDGRPQNLADRMRRARMRLVAQSPESDERSTS